MSKNYEIVAGAEEHTHEEIVKVTLYCKRYHIHGRCNGSRVPHCMSEDIDMVNAMRKALGMRTFTIYERDYIICGVQDI